MNLQQINTNTLEGRLLMSALARLTVQVDKDKTPEECLAHVSAIAEQMYKDSPELNSTAEAMKTLANALIKDKDYYQGWLSNLSMAFQDRIHKFFNDQRIMMPTHQHHLFRDSCNQAAADFIAHIIDEQLRKFPTKVFIKHAGGQLEELSNGRLDGIQKPPGSVSDQIAQSFGKSCAGPADLQPCVNPNEKREDWRL